MNKLLNDFKTDFLKPYLQLMRLDKPIGIWLLFLPCLFGTMLSVKSNPRFDLIYLIGLFFLGSVIMRSAGCVLNDIIDRDFDKKVARTLNRPLASGEISLKNAIIFLIILLFLGLIILLSFNLETFFLGLIALFLVVLYPFTKRFTYFPQLFLGFAFNFGILMSSTAIAEKITLPIITLYISAIFWTLFYDTIYAYQDIEDDIKIGVKSTALKFGKTPQKALYFLASYQISFLLLTGILSGLGMIYYLFIFVALCHLICQIRNCDFTNPQSCLKHFKSNILLGIIILTALILG